MIVAGLKFWVILLFTVSISSVLCNRRIDGRSDGSKTKEADTPFWAARGKRMDVANLVRCGLLRQDLESEAAWPDPDSNPDGLVDELGSRLKRSSLPIHKVESVLEPLWLTRGSMELDRPVFQRFFDPSRNERLLSLWKQLQDKRTGDKTSSNSESAPFWAARG